MREEERLRNCFGLKLKHADSQTPVAHAYNPSYLEDGDQEDHGSRSAQATPSPIFKITRAKYGLGVRCCKCKVLRSNPSPTKKKKKKKKSYR
jgi:hypothetical protein